MCFQNEISVVVAKKNTNQRNTLQIRFQSGVVEENRVQGEEKNRARFLLLLLLLVVVVVVVVLQSRALIN